MEGVIGIKPEIKKIVWEQTSIMQIYLKDGRVISLPVKLLPSAKKVKPADRSHAQIINGNMFTWSSCSEVFHIEQVLGKEKDYAYRN